MNSKKIVIANWKMNPVTLNEAKRLFEIIKKGTARLSKISVVICPPFLFLSELKKNYKGRLISFGGQNCFWEKEGAFTGEISPSMLANIGASYVIIGHSERRVLGEDDFEINKKVLEALKARLKVCLCIGESERDEEGDYMEFLRGQIHNALEKVDKSLLDDVIIAYEPVWSVGKESKGVMSGRELHETYIFIKKVLFDMYDRTSADSVKILYGGSVDVGNVKDLMSGCIDGFLVGRKSLIVEDFVKILGNVNTL